MKQLILPVPELIANQYNRLVKCRKCGHTQVICIKLPEGKRRLKARPTCDICRTKFIYKRAPQ